MPDSAGIMYTKQKSKGIMLLEANPGTDSSGKKPILHSHAKVLPWVVHNDSRILQEESKLKKKNTVCVVQWETLSGGVPGG